MPQVDPETLLRGTESGGDGRDGKVTCETLLNSADDAPPDHPPESYYIAKEDEQDWFDRNGFLDRRESINKTNLNPKARSQHLSSHSKSKPSIIGLPKPQTSSFPNSKSRRCVKSANTRIFPKRLGSGGKFSLRMSEPSSPKVSCMGKVRSRNRCRRSTEKKNSGNNNTKPEKGGFWPGLKKIFGLKCGKKHAVDADEPSQKSNSPKKNVKVEKEKREGEGEKAVNAPGLGGMNRFISGRRSDSWAGDACDLRWEQ